MGLQQKCSLDLNYLYNFKCRNNNGGNNKKKKNRIVVNIICKNQNYISNNIQFKK